ncbi:MAG: GNAT family N-acetyltransferase [Christensenellaceae bacterium]
MREIPALDLFMMCEKINTAAFGALPAGYFFRHPREDELDAWIRLNIEDEAHYDFVKAYYLRVYAPKKERFFKRCIFVCNEADIPIGTCFTWKSYEQFYTIHWLKVKKEYERKGVGRALLTHILSTLEESDNPIYLHTHPSSLAAIKLYTDFGFAF